ncbi:hypothetical protein ACILG0_17095 [Pseudomonadota bacterium AL_CKDN230030165-1A_HGKHYDSX7]
MADVVGFLVKLWASGAEQLGDSYVLILERSVSGEPALDGAFPLSDLTAVVRALPTTTAPDLVARTSILVLSNPRGAAREAITARRGCSALEADAYYGTVLQKAGQLADENGMRKSGGFLGLSLSDVEVEVNRLAPLFTSERILAALSRGLCEAVDFATPTEDPNFFAGVDVQPGHVVAGLLVERAALRDEVIGALAERRIVLLKGPSGAGKSALQWDAAYSIRHAVRWFRVRHLAVEDIGDLVILANSCGASAEAPVGFLLDNLSAGLMDGWDALAREVATKPGLALLASIREEDIYTLAERGRAVEVPVRAESEFAERFWRELRDKGITSWTNWQEPWNQSNELLLEYAHILTQGSRLAETLRQQVAARVGDPARHPELEVLRVCAAITCLGARVDVAKLPKVLRRSAIEVGSVFPRIVNEHLLRDLGDGSIGGVHELRSLHLLSETNHVSADTELQTFVQALDAVLELDLGVFLTRALGRHPSLEESFLEALAGRLNARPSMLLMTTILTGLGERQIEQGIDIWLKSPEVASVPRSILPAVALFGVSGVEVPGLSAESSAASAARLLTEIKSRSTENHLRGRLLQRMSESGVHALVSSAPGLASLNAFLVAHVGHALAPGLRDALLRMSPDLVSSDLAQVGELLGTVHLLEPEIARRWVESAGAAELLDRVGTEVPWATPAVTRQEPEGLAVASDIRVVSERYQPAQHDDVVALCELLLALCPAADLAISRAVAGRGVVAGIEGFNVADKRIPRDNLPPNSLPAWNRRWSEAINQRLAPASYGAFLIEVVGQLEKMNSALRETLDGELRGVRNAAAFDSLGEVHIRSQALPSPRIPWSADGARLAQKDSQLQQILFDCSATLLRRFAGLPQDSMSYIAWLGGVLKRIREAIAQEPWHLMPQGSGGGKPLEELCEIVEDLLALAGEGVQREKNPILLYRRLHAPSGRVLTDARESAKKKMRRLKRSVEDELRCSFRRVRPGTHVNVRNSTEEPLLWPMLEVLVTIELDRIHDWIATVDDGWLNWRKLVDETMRLTVMPVVNGMHVPMCGLSGVDKPFPAEARAREWMTQAGLRPMPEAATSMWRTFCEAAMDFAVFASQGLGLDDRPALERTSRADVLARLVASKAAIDGTLPPLLREMTNTLVALAIQQPDELLESQLGILRQELTPIAEVLLDAQYACYSVDLGMAPAHVWVESASQEGGAQPDADLENS